MQIFVNSKYDCVKWRFYAVSFSLLFMLLGLAMFFKHGVNWGIDFAGGATIKLRFKDPVPMDRLLAELADAPTLLVVNDPFPMAPLPADLPAAKIQQYGQVGDTSLIIRLPELTKETDY